MSLIAAVLAVGSRDRCSDRRVEGQSRNRTSLRLGVRRSALVSAQCEGHIGRFGIDNTLVVGVSNDDAKGSCVGGFLTFFSQAASPVSSPLCQQEAKPPAGG